MILHTLRLRGAIGIREGLGLEEINIDFRKFSPGLIAIVGENGSGKTSTIENLHPYRFLKSRPGGLARQFFLKDSCRDLLLEINGDQVRFLIEMNPTLKTPAIKSYVHRNGICLNPDGSEESYNAAVAKLFGDPDLFFSSLFMPQKRVPFSKVDSAKRKDLLLELIGAGHLEAKCDYAGTAAKALREEIARVTGEINSLALSARPAEEIAAEISAHQKLLETDRQELERLVSVIATCQRNLESLQAKQTAQAVLQTQLSQAKARRDEINTERATATAGFDQKIRQLQIVIDSDRLEHDRLTKHCESADAAAIEAGMARLEQAKIAYLEMVERRHEYDRLAGELKQVTHDRDMAKQSHASELKARQDRVDAAKRAYDDARKVFDATRTKLTDEIARQTYASQTLQTVPCQSESVPEDCRTICQSCQFLKDATAAIEVIRDLSAKLTTAELNWIGNEAALSGDIATANSAVATYRTWEQAAIPLQATIDSARAAIEALGFDVVAADELKRQYDACERADWPGRKSRLEQARTRLDTLSQKMVDDRKRIEDLHAERSAKCAENDQQIAALASEIASLEPRIDIAIDLRIRDERELLRKADVDRPATIERIASREAHVAGLIEDKARSQQSAEELATKRVTLGCLQSDMADWEHLSLALSRNGGFQSILVESAGPEITVFANEQLKLYDIPWTIEISTCRPSVDGKKMVDGFFVTVNAPSGSRELSDLSGGEEVIVDQVIYDAIANMLRRRSGLHLQTAIRDECDGALDGDRAMDYVRVTEAAHQLSGLHHTLLITHRETIQQLIPNRLRFVKGQGIIVEAA